MKKLQLFLFLLFPTIIFSQTILTLESQTAINGGVNDIWGYEDGQGNEYALVGWKEGVKIYDITNSTPVLKGDLPGSSSIPRDIAVWDKYAYVTSENNDGLVIVDLSNLPSTNVTDTVQIRGFGGIQLVRAHNCFIDENGVLYLFGSNHSNGGVLMLDVKTDPLKPTFLGKVDETYVHDGVARGDTLYTADMMKGEFSTYDISDKANPILLARAKTPFEFAHNIYPDATGKTVFTTDEKSGAPIASFDVSDKQNVQQLGLFYELPLEGVVPHNLYYFNDYLIVASYTSGVFVLDVKRPNNMIKVGQYDTSPLKGSSFEGAWGAYPYFSSGKLIVSDRQEGLFVFNIGYKRACYLEGNVKEEGTSNNLEGVRVELLGESLEVETVNDGSYATGIPESGSYKVIFSKVGYKSDTVDVTLNNGVLTTVNTQLKKLPSSDLIIKVRFENLSTNFTATKAEIYGENYNIEIPIDNGGVGKIAELHHAQFSVVAGNWGYLQDCQQITHDANSDTIFLTLKHGYKDDFALHLGWTSIGTAGDGEWVRGVPYGTEKDGVQYNPEEDHDGDCGSKCFQTENVKGIPENGNVNHLTRLISPTMNLTSYSDPYLSYYRWFSTTSVAGEDSMWVWILKGTDTVRVKSYKYNANENAKWMYDEIRVKDYISDLSNVRVLFGSKDNLNPFDIIDCAVDNFEVNNGPEVGTKELLIAEQLYIDASKVLRSKTSKLINKPFVLYDVKGRRVDDGIVGVSFLRVKPGVYFVSIAGERTVRLLVK